MATLYDVVLQKKQEKSQITANPTLDAFDGTYCKELDALAATDAFVADRIAKAIHELDLAGGVDYNDHYRTAYDNYNEAVCYHELKKRGFAVRNIPEQTNPTPDFEVEFSFKDSEQNIVARKVYVEVKSLSFAGGNNGYKEIQKEALECNIDLEEQHKRGKQICSTELEIAPLGHGNGPTYEIEELNKKINNNIKQGQYQYGNGQDTILLVDLSQYTFPFKHEECLPIYPDMKRKYCASGRLWMLAFGREGERIFDWPEFEGRGCFDKDLTLPGILNCHDYIKGIIFTSGVRPCDRVFQGLYRHKEEDLEVVSFLYQACGFVNDDLNTNGFKVY